MHFRLNGEISIKHIMIKNGLKVKKKWFLERFGWKSASKLNNFLKTRSRILDAGTGVGNSAKLFSSNPNSQVFGIDASESIEFGL